MNWALDSPSPGAAQPPASPPAAWPRKGRERDVGAFAVGRFGDIIAVDGDPIADVRQLEDVDVVIKGGKIEKNEN